MFIELLHRRKNILLYALAIFLMLSCIFMTVILVLESKTKEVERAEVAKGEERLVTLEKDILSNRIDKLSSDLLYVADKFHSYQDDSNDDKKIQEDLKAFADRKKIYDQIRYLDVDGNEKIRINYSEKGSIVVPERELQNKKDRDYFRDAIGLKKDQIYISKLDLNIENGAIEQPIKPMIRLATLVYGRNGNLKGMVILNYYASNLIQEFERIASTSSGTVFLLDANGYWLYHGKNKAKEWSFMYKEKQEISFKNEFPSEWDTIKQSDKGRLTTDEGIYFYSTIIPISEDTADQTAQGKQSIVLGEGNWIAVSVIAMNSKNGASFNTNVYQNMKGTLETHKFNLLLILLVSIVFSILFVTNKISNERIQYFSEYDTMTGVFNRRAGFEVLSKIYKNIMKKEGQMSVCFVDINGLKEVNDHLGHEAGDELILSVVNGIKKCIRQSDFIARLGGDEFIIIFVDINQEQAEDIWHRIYDGYQQINDTENRKYIISASHGIEEFQFKANEQIDAIINHADAKMYSEKRIMKKDLEIVRTT